MQGYIWIFGGRAREFVDLPEEKSIGGIIGPHVADIPRTEANALQQFSTQREVSVYKSDVWRSTDGEQWELVNPGCKVGQATLLADGNVHEGKKGTFSSKCNADIDCYGAETCDQTYKTCVCAIWSPREQHAVATDPENNFLYLSGGFASRLYSEHSDCGPYACGQTAASDYRYYLSDVWRSANGQEWTLITESAFGNIGRGGHSMLVFPFTYNGALSLWVIGGKTGDNTFSGGPEVFLNDIWTSPLTGSLPAPTQWTALAIQGSYHMPWSPRTGHTVAFEDKSLNIPNARTLYLYGGQTAEGVSGDLWAWRLDDPNDSWRKDFTPASLYTSGTGSELSYHNNSPAVNYLTPDSDLLALKRFWVPTKPSTTGSRYELRSYIPQADIEAMRSVGLNTIAELAAADLYTVLKLRGFDIPQVPLNQRYKVSAICDYRAFAKAIVDKCSLTVPSLYDGERQMPWNIVPVFGGKAPKRDPIAWHGRGSYDMLQPPVDDVDVRTAEWDGCLFDGVIQGLHGPDVSGVGYVTQVSSVRKPDPEVQNLFCRQGPGPRVFHSMVFFKEGLYLFGGKTNPGLFHADTWLRDAGLPSATIVSAPGDRTSANWFIFRANEAGCYFEYRLWDPINYKEIRGWTPVTFKTSVYWLNWRVGGPGNGQYTMYVRAVDPAGNRDDVFIKGINVVTWYYVSPTPWDIIFGIVGAFVGLCIIAYFEYRRRVKKAAMERYAMKRMRRKFKAMQRDVEGRAVDWRTLYMESKQAEDMGKREKKKLKKTRDKNAEKRDKEKKKREKEKELIKRKLKANKDFKAKSASSKAEESSKTKSSRKNQVVPSSLDAEGALAVVPEGDEEDGDIEAPPMVKGRSKARLMASSSKGASSKVAPGTEDDDGEEGKALADTETGFKSRKVNKRYKAYEAGTAPGGGDEEKDGDGPELFRKGSSKDK